MADITSLTRFTDGSIACRQAGLPGPLRDLHRAVLRRFLETGAAPTARWVRHTALDIGLDASAVDELEAADAIHVSNGIVTVAYPVTGGPQRSRATRWRTRASGSRSAGQPLRASWVRSSSVPAPTTPARPGC